MERVSFEEAISDEKLLKDHFDSLSWPIAVALKAFYGLQLRSNVVNPQTGFSELDYWAITQNSCDYDELGYVTKVYPIPYIAKEYDQLWGVVGRRAGKTSGLQSTIIAYEATLGGHEEYVSPKQDCLIYLIGHRLNLAVSSLQFVRSILDSSPILSREIVKQNNDEIRLKNGISIVPSPPSLKAQRGLACPAVAMDEVGFWYSDPEAANPDVEVERAVTWAQLQFPNSKRLGISTPWIKEGLLWKYHKAGTEGMKLTEDQRSEYKGILHVFGTTASFENPLNTREKLAKEKLQDPDGYVRESLCVFPDSISGFLARPLIDIATAKAKGIAERPPVSELEVARSGGSKGYAPSYVAAMDPAFRRDSFAFCIVHRDPDKGIVLDAVRRWKPSKNTKVNPKEVLTEIKQLITPYGIDFIYTDQYQLESLEQLAIDLDMSIGGVDFTAKSKAKIFGNLQQLTNQQKLELLDPDLNEVADEMVRELVMLERRLTHTGGVQISAPEGKHDDLASVLALAAFKAMWHHPTEVEEDQSLREPTLFERCMQTVQRRTLQLQEY